MSSRAVAAVAATTPLPKCYVQCASLPLIDAERAASLDPIAANTPLWIDATTSWSGRPVVDILADDYGARRLSDMRAIYGSPAQLERSEWLDGEKAERVRSLVDDWTIADYLRAARADRAPFYLANLALRQFPAIQERYRSPRIGPRNLVGFFERAAAPELFVGCSNTRYSNLHVDAMGGSVWCVGLAGAKEWIVFPPADSERLAPFRDGDLQLRHSLLDPWDEAICAKFPTKELHPFRVVLEAGQALFLPPNWWHVTRNHGLTVTINERLWSWRSLGYFARGLWHEAVPRLLRTTQPYQLY